MEREIGEIFEFEGNKLKVEQGYLGCEGCFFKNIICNPLRKYRGECSQCNREDKTEIIFVKIVD